MDTLDLKNAPAEFAPDGSQIRRLLALKGASFGYCTLPPGHTAKAIRHRSVEELWFVFKGIGQLWRKLGAAESVVDLAPGVCVVILRGAHFQFRNTGREPLEFVLCTLPPWSDASEAIRVVEHWPSS